MCKEKIISLLEKWRKKIEQMEIEFKYCHEHNFDLEAKRINSSIMILKNCKMELEDTFGIDISV